MTPAAMPALLIALVTPKPVTPFDTLTSGLASIARLPLGTNVAAPLESLAPPAAAEPSLTLYDVEADADCRRVREVLTFLDCSARIIPCGAGSRHLDELSSSSGGAARDLPVLFDSNAGVTLEGADEACDHLFRTYGAPLGVAPESMPSPTLPFDWLPSLLRAGRGSTVEPGVRTRPSPPMPLVLYSYDGNQFCRLVREVLTELDLPYELRSTGKGSRLRAELQQLQGKTTCPFLVDPNEGGSSLGESADIVDYLIERYG
jgi:glutaredoxin